VVLVEQQPEGSSGQRMQVAMHQRMPVAEMMHAGTQSSSSQQFSSGAHRLSRTAVRIEALTFRLVEQYVFYQTSSEPNETTKTRDQIDL